MNFNQDCTVFEARGRGGWGAGRGGGGVFPYIGHIGMCRPYRIGFLHRFGHTLGPFWSGIGYGFQGNYGSV